MRVAGRFGFFLATALVAGVLASPAAAAPPYLYATVGSVPADTAGFSIEGSGALTSIPGAAEDLGAFPRDAVVSPDAKHLYVASFGLQGFDIAADGSLTAMAGSPFGGGQAFAQMAVSPDGSRLYASAQNANQVFGFDVAADGQLTAVPGSPFASGTFTFGTAMTPDGRFLYVANSAADTISAFSIATDGSLTQIPGSPFANGAGTDPVNPAITQDGKYLYIANNDAASVSAYAIGADGALSVVPGAPFASGSGPFGVTLSPNGAQAYVGAEIGNNISAYNVGGNGALTPVAGSPFPAGGLTRKVAITPDGTRAFAGNVTNDSIWRYTRNQATGALGALALPTVVADGVSALAMTPNQPPPAQFETAFPGGRTVAFRSVGLDPETGAEPATFSWNFGDGTSTSGPDGGPDHEYAKDGTYEVRLVVADAGNCGPFQVYTGQTMYCNGGPVAVIRKDVTVDTEVLNPRFEAKKTQRQKGSKVVVKVKAGADEDVAVTAYKGRIKIAGAPRKVKLAPTKAREAKAGTLRLLKLKVKGAKSKALVHNALGAGAKVKASVIAKIDDSYGHSATKKLKVKLK